MNLGKGLFVTGTDTGVGKTVIAAAIAGSLRRRGLDVGVMKPFQTGALRAGERWTAPDAEFLKSVSGVDDEIELICPAMLEPPLAPSVAASISGRSVTIDDVLPSFVELSRRHAFVIVEGAGGLGVPIHEKTTMRDLAAAMNLPVLIVARPGLGTINHTLLTVEYARAAGLCIAGIVISNYPSEPDVAARTNPEAVAELTGCPLLGIFKHDPSVDTDSGEAGSIVDDMAVDPLIEHLCLLLTCRSHSP